MTLEVLREVLRPGGVAVITGGASGIGLAAARRFAGLGMRVAIADLGADRLAAAEGTLAAEAPGARARCWRSRRDVSRRRRRCAASSRRCASASVAPTC